MTTKLRIKKSGSESGLSGAEGKTSEFSFSASSSAVAVSATGSKSGSKIGKKRITVSSKSVVGNLGPDFSASRSSRRIDGREAAASFSSSVTTGTPTPGRKRTLASKKSPHKFSGRGSPNAKRNLKSGGVNTSDRTQIPSAAFEIGYVPSGSGSSTRVPTPKFSILSPSSSSSVSHKAKW
eukprot:CAMPEP_0114982970 /NCGR_PEP_ID=MMETSP0216-20121206/6430_1 /TAXON_ID=223996 /ORGANISM="Protocruzia adherens, Strain Boccale" /LENGTH=179 /DNA_ID=CAMNT_0002344881 /DNA_START=895 /DNA_END=1431 /DNA_ORIENTATION=+